MKAKLFLIGGIIMAPIATCGIVWCKFYVWGVCPQALVVMFIRQTIDGPDSLGLPDLPELAMAILYYPIIGWRLARGAEQGQLLRVSVVITFWHVIALALAWGACALRNSQWGL